MIRRLVHLVRRRIAIKLTLTLVGFVAISVLVAGLYLDRALQAFAVTTLEARLLTAGRLLEDEARFLLLTGPSASEAHRFAVRTTGQTDLRLTLVGPGGQVLADSDTAPAELARAENLRAQPEVWAALAGRPGKELRPSPRMDTTLLYVALPVTDGGRVIGALRLAVPLTEVVVSRGAIQRALLVGGLVALVVALAIGVFVAGRLTRPVIEMEAIARRMSEGNFAAQAPVRSPDEIGVLGRALNLLAGRLREKVQDLEEEQAKARAILESMVEGVIAVDGHDRIVVINERARAIFALAPARAERRPFLEVIRNADLHQIFRDSRAAQEGEVLRRELRLTTPVERALQVHAAPLGLAGAGLGVVMVLHDITELRRLEQVRTEFVANVSHELRTPLTAIHGYIETLLGGALEEPENARRFLEIVHRQTERLGRLVNDLTDLSNIELGRVTLRLEPLRLEDLVESVLTIIRPRAVQGQVALSTDLPPDLPAVRADRDRLAQVLINLVDNGVKYTPVGGQVTVSARSRDGMVEMTVADTGVGIPPADLARVTERFYRVDRARSRELGGTGLGLAIVKHLVIAHGGELRLESEPERGTAVRFTVPAAAP